MLTIRKIRVASGDSAAAKRTADYVLGAAESPLAVSRVLNGASATWPATTQWLGSPSMLERLHVERLAEVAPEELALAVQGRSAGTGERLRTEGMIQRDALDDEGRPIYDDKGRRKQVRVKGTKTVDLTFSAPKSVSVAWSQARSDVRVGIEAAMLAGANAMLETMTLTKPVVAQHRALHPAHGFAAAASLHVMARASQREKAPAPQLHVHAIVIGVEREDGFFASPELSGMFKNGAPLEGGAVARLKLAERLADMGFRIDRGGRFFEIGGVPRGLIQRMSGRTADVMTRIGEREAIKGKPLSGRERSVAALETRLPKSKEASLADTVARWTAHAAEFGFDDAAVEGLRSSSSPFEIELDDRRAAVAAAVRATDPPVTLGEARARVLERAAGLLRADEVDPLLDELVV